MEIGSLDEDVVLKNVNYAESRSNNRAYASCPDGGINEVQQNILKILEENPAVRTQAIADTLGLTRRKVEYHINRLKQEGLVERRGAKKTGHWVVTSV